MQCLRGAFWRAILRYDLQKHCINTCSDKFPLFGCVSFYSFVIWVLCVFGIFFFLLKRNIQKFAHMHFHKVNIAIETEPRSLDFLKSLLISFGRKMKPCESAVYKGKCDL